MSAMQDMTKGGAAGHLLRYAADAGQLVPAGV